MNPIERGARENNSANSLQCQNHSRHCGMYFGTCTSETVLQTDEDLFRGSKSAAAPTPPQRDKNPLHNMIIIYIIIYTHNFYTKLSKPKN